jgi:hypothetical protein
MDYFIFRKNLLLLLFLSLSFICIAQESNKNNFNISITVEPEWSNGSIPRGITLNYANYIKPYFTLGLSSRIINRDYTSLWGTTSFIINIGNSISIPLEIGAGLKVKNLELSESNDEGLGAFYHAQTGINWYFSPSWCYTLQCVYNYDIFNDKSHTIFINIGMSYLF